jgi:hypothetical protein
MVVYGDAIPLLRWDSPVANRVKDAISDGVKVCRLQEQHESQKLTSNDMRPNLDYLQATGWEYIRS